MDEKLELYYYLKKDFESYDSRLFREKTNGSYTNPLKYFLITADSLFKFYFKDFFVITDIRDNFLLNEDEISILINNKILETPPLSKFIVNNVNNFSIETQFGALKIFFKKDSIQEELIQYVIKRLLNDKDIAKRFGIYEQVHR